MKNKSRDEGFYWVKWDGRWRIGEYAQGNWYLTQSLSYLDDIDLEKVHEHRITAPEEKATDAECGSMYD